MHHLWIMSNLVLKVAYFLLQSSENVTCSAGLINPFRYRRNASCQKIHIYPQWNLLYKTSTERFSNAATASVQQFAMKLWGYPSTKDVISSTLCPGEVSLRTLSTLTSLYTEEVDFLVNQWSDVGPAEVFIEVKEALTALSMTLVPVHNVL